MAKIYIISTPIGNIKDITLRSLEILKKVDIVICEDSRQFFKLANKYNLGKKKIFICHNQNESKVSTKIVNYVEKNNSSVALISDAGTPVLNDPGFLIIKKALEKKIEIEIVPGPSAIISAVVLANFGSNFSFIGFLNPRTIKRKNQLKKLVNGTYVAFLSPHRLVSELEDLQEVFGTQLEIFLGKEMTKKFEQHFRGTIKEVIKAVKEKSIRGEYTAVFKVEK